MVKKQAATAKEGTVYVRSDGMSFKQPKIDATEILKILENKYITQGLDQMQMTIFQDDIVLKVIDKDKKEDPDLTASLTDMVINNPKVAFNFSTQRRWRDVMEWGPALSNPVWDYEGPEYRLMELNRLPPSSFSKKGSSSTLVYNRLLPGICINDKTGEQEYWQTQRNTQVTQLTNVHMTTTPMCAELGGTPYILPVFPIVKMLTYSWGRQMQKVNQWGSGGNWFIKVTDPQGDDEAYAAKLLKNQSSINRYQLRGNMTAENLGISGDGSALETITELGMQIRQFFIASDLGKDGGQLIGGSNSAELKKYMSFIKGMHRWIEWDALLMLKPWADYNGYTDKGYQILVDVPAPEIDQSDLWLKIAREGNQSGTVTENEHRAMLSKAGAGDILKPLDDVALAALREQKASTSQNSFGAQLQKADVATRAGAANIINKSRARAFVQATLGIKEGESDNDAGDSAESAALDRLASAAEGLTRAANGSPHTQADSEEGEWITIGGAHILLKDGESPADGFKRTTGADLKGGGSSDAGGSSSKGATVTNDHKDYDKKLVKALGMGSNKELGGKIAAEQEKGMDENFAYGKQFENDSTVNDYTRTGYAKLNNDLRSGKTDSPSVAKLDKIVSGSPVLPEGTVLYRGIGERGVSSMMNMKPGDTCNDKAFQSFSTNPNNSMQFTTRATVEGEKGAHKVLLRAVTSGKEKGFVVGGGEHEIILPRGSGWKVVSNNAVTSGVNAGKVTTHVITVVPA